MNPTEKRFGAFSSSVNPQKLAASVEGAIATIASLLVFAGFFDAATATTLLSHVNALVTDIMVLIPLVSGMASLCYTIFGLLRKAVVAFSSRKSAPVQAVTPVAV